MRYLKSYNEGVLSKARELLNFSKKADLLCKKYIKMIYDDWNKHHDLYRVSIIDGGDGYTHLHYMITDGDQNDVQLGNRDENAITIEFSYIKNILGWGNDTTQARLKATKFKSYLGDRYIVGKVINTGEIIESEEGSNKNPTMCNDPSFSLFLSLF